MKAIVNDELEGFKGRLNIGIDCPMASTLKGGVDMPLSSRCLHQTIKMCDSMGNISSRNGVMAVVVVSKAESRNPEILESWNHGCSQTRSRLLNGSLVL